MANQTVRRGAGGTGRQRAVAAAARAAAKRSERAQQTGAEPEEQAGQQAEDTGTGSAAPGRAPSEGNGAGSGGRSRTSGAAKVREVPDTAGRASGRRSDVVRAVLAVLVLAGLVATTLLGMAYRDAGQTRRASKEAVAAARTMAPKVLSYDYRHLDRDFATARRHLTGSFRAEYGRTTSRVVAPTAAKYKGSVKATVARPPGGHGGADDAVSVVSASPDKVVVLLFMNQITESAKISNPRVDLNRVRMTLVRTLDGWKASAVDAL